MNFYVVRHPWTEWNIKGISQGHADSPLLAESREQAKEMGKSLAGKGISKIYTSDLGRCIETTSLINENLNVPIIATAQLREQNQGKYNGKSKSFIKEKLGDQFNEEDFVPEDGESLVQVKKRVIQFLETLHERTPILIVTHDGCVQSLLSHALGSKIQATQTKTTTRTITEFEWDHTSLRIVNQWECV